MCHSDTSSGAELTGVVITSLAQQGLEELHDPSAVHPCYTVWESIPEHSEHLFSSGLPMHDYEP